MKRSLPPVAAAISALVLSFALSLGLAPLTAALAAAASEPDPAGIWKRGDGNAEVRIAACGDKICAVNLWIGDTSGGEEVGDRLVLTLKPKDEDTLAGTAYDPKRNRTYAMTMRVEEDRLVTRGCILAGLLCKSVTWSRAD